MRQQRTELTDSTGGIVDVVRVFELVQRRTRSQHLEHVVVELVVVHAVLELLQQLQLVLRWRRVELFEQFELVVRWRWRRIQQLQQLQLIGVPALRRRPRR